jgi:large subunit ribosomal protein L6
MVWGMSRALMANAISGAKAPFERIVEIKGLGFKATRVGDSLEFSLGYSHKITCDIPENVTIEIDKTGQKLTLKSFDKEALGAFCDRIKSFRRPEPYKGTGIKLSTETIARKAGKAKSA